MPDLFVHSLKHYRGHKGAIYSLCHGFSMGEFLSAGSDGFICRWHHGSSDDGEVMAQTGGPIFCLFTFSEKKLIFAGSMQGDLFQLSLLESKDVKRFRFHQPSIFRMTSWNDLLMVAGGDGILSQWNPENGKVIHHLKISEQKLRSLCIDNTGNRIFAGDSQGNIWVLNPNDFSLIEKRTGVHQKTVFSLAYLEKESFLVSGGLDAHICVQNKEFKKLNEIKAHWFCINDICDLKGSNYIATASRDKTIRIWDKRDWHLEKEISSPKFAGHSHSVNSLLWNEEQDLLYSAGDDGNIFGWKFEI